MKLKNCKGISGVDITISIGILIIFVSLIAGLFYNLASSSKQIERKAVATNLAIEIIEALKVTDFSNLNSTEKNQMTIEQLNEYSSKQISIPKEYTTKILIENYKNEDILKTLRVEVSYEVNNQIETIDIETLVKNI